MRKPTAKPILMNKEMVRAVLSGQKSQTRRPVTLTPGFKPELPVKFARITRPESHPKHGKLGLCLTKDKGKYQESDIAVCPFGQVDDLLWVRETFQGPLVDEENYEALTDKPKQFESPEHCRYRASGDSAEYFDLATDETVYRWKPSIHMPRWASRLTLRITDVRVEQLEDISEEDAIREGFSLSPEDPRFYEIHDWRFPTAKGAFRHLWREIYLNTPHCSNPWVWVIEFEVINKNVDQVLKELEAAA